METQLSGLDPRALGVLAPPLNLSVHLDTPVFIQRSRQLKAQMVSLQDRPAIRSQHGDLGHVGYTSQSLGSTIPNLTPKINRPEHNLPSEPVVEESWLDLDSDASEECSRLGAFEWLGQLIKSKRNGRVFHCRRR